MDRQMHQNISFFIALCCCILFYGCTKDKPDSARQSLPTSNTRKVLINCEGSLGNGNASLSVYLPGKDSVFSNVFFQANGQHLGDVFQHICRIDNRYYLSINNSDKIEVIDTNNWMRRQTILVQKPRQILTVSNGKAYAGSLFSNKIHILNTQTGEAASSISMPYQNVEDMLLYKGKVYCTCWDTACSYIYTIDPGTDQITDSIRIAGKASHSLVIDNKNHLWVLSGNTYKGSRSCFSRIDLLTGKLTESFYFNEGVEAIKACTTPKADSIYFIEVNYSGGTENNGIYRFSTETKKLPETPFIQAERFQYFWALGIDPYSGNIYVGDPKGFIQKSEVLIYTPGKRKVRSFSTGVGVGDFYFD